jgi:transposase-like protein
MMEMFDAESFIKIAEPLCKKCGSDHMVKSGIIGGRQRFRCKVCGCNFRAGDGRTDEQIAAKRLLCVLLHFLGKNSFRMLGRLLQTDYTLVYRWVKEFDGNLPKNDVTGEIKELMFDELLQFVNSKKEVLSSRSLVVADGELWPGCLATVILQFPTNTQ